jgi:hypothetical protein
MMSVQSVKARHFGANNGPICAKCNRLMHIARRSPHPIYGNSYEMQIFECRNCKIEIERSADEDGCPHASDAAPLPQYPQD